MSSTREDGETPTSYFDDCDVCAGWVRFAGLNGACAACEDWLRKICHLFGGEPASETRQQSRPER